MRRVLSQRRAEHVRDYLIGRGVNPSQILLSFSGEQYTVGRAEEDELDRAVLVVAPMIPHPPPPPIHIKVDDGDKRPVPTPPPPRPRFAFRLLRILSLGPVVAARFQVRDYATPPMTAYYEFRGGSLSFGTPISFAGQGGWNEFTPLLSRPARASDFGGPVSWGGLSMPIQTPRGVEFFDATELTLNGVPGLPYVFRPFRSGNTIGAGIGVSAGLMGVDSPLVPYPGPEGGL